MAKMRREEEKTACLRLVIGTNQLTSAKYTSLMIDDKMNGYVKVSSDLLHLVQFLIFTP